jgi:hypothetical protein
MLVTWDVSRFIRSEAYHRGTNNNVEPSPEEFSLLHERTHGLILATIVHPSLTESERHSLATKRSGKCGRPSIIDESKALKILAMRYQAEHKSLKDIADALGLKIAAVQRFLDKLKHHTDPTAAYFDYLKSRQPSLNGHRPESNNK